MSILLTPQLGPGEWADIISCVFTIVALAFTLYLWLLDNLSGDESKFVEKKGEILKELNACLESLEDTSKDTPTDEKPSKDFLQTLLKADTQLEALVSYRFWARSKQKEEFEKIRVFHEDSRYLISLIKRLTEPPKRSNLSESTEQPKSLAAVLPLNRTQLKEIRNAYRNGLLFIIEFIENRE